MIDGNELVEALEREGVTHVVWIPDSELGTWEPALSSAKSLALIRVCREGEAFAIAAGLWLGGKKPIVVVQCTGLFEAGDALRNVLHDLQLPLFFIVGVRSWHVHQQGKGVDTCPIFTEPILQAWRVPYDLLADAAAGDVSAAYRRCLAEGTARALLIAE
ncbi:MAG: thiamine pyrophosphate-binding protein [Gemmataceae bacterium]